MNMFTRKIENVAKFYHKNKTKTIYKNSYNILRIFRSVCCFLFHFAERNGTLYYIFYIKTSKVVLRIKEVLPQRIVKHASNFYFVYFIYSDLYTKLQTE